MTLIDSLGVESSINDFQLLLIEKLFNNLSQNEKHWAASIGSRASLILSSRFQAQKIINKTSANIPLEIIALAQQDQEIIFFFTSSAKWSYLKRNCLEDSNPLRAERHLQAQTDFEYRELCCWNILALDCGSLSLSKTLVDTILCEVNFQ